MIEQEQKGDVLSPQQQGVIAAREMQKLATKVPAKIKNDIELKETTELLAQVKMTAKNIKAQKDPVIKGLNESIKSIRDWFKPAEEAGEAVEKSLKEAILEYHERMEAKAAKKADKIEAAVDAGTMSLADGMGKLSNVKQAETDIRTASGGAQIRVNKKVRIIDVAALPAGYFIRPRVLEALRIEVADDVLRQKKPCPTGAEVYEEKGVAGING